MLSPEDIRRRALIRYVDFLRSIVNGSDFFPLPIRFGKPSATEGFDKLRNEITALTQANLGCHIEWTAVNSRRWGKQRLPERVEFADEASYLRALGKTKEVSRFRENLTLTRERCQSLVPFIEMRPIDMVDFNDVWPGLLEVCCYLQLHPRPNLYARELPLSVDTKFVERYQTILTRLLPVALAPSSLVEAGRFEECFGLRYEEPQIRLRFLDESVRTTLGVPFHDIALPLGEFRTLRWSGLRVVISENKMTFLTLPPVPRAIGIWGAGNAAALLHDVPWLADCEMLYWGDLDAQGFEILSRLRDAFPKTQGLMMDKTTLQRFEKLCVPGVPAKPKPTLRLTPSEIEAYTIVQSSNVRLEQERIPNDFTTQTIMATTTQNWTDVSRDEGLANKQSD